MHTTPGAPVIAAAKGGAPLLDRIAAGSFPQLAHAVNQANGALAPISFRYEMEQSVPQRVRPAAVVFQKLEEGANLGQQLILQVQEPLDIETQEAFPRFKAARGVA